MLCQAWRSHLQVLSFQADEISPKPPPRRVWAQGLVEPASSNDAPSHRPWELPWAAGVAAGRGFQTKLTQSVHSFYQLGKGNTKKPWHVSSKVTAEYLKFIDFRQAKIITPTATGIQPVSIVIKAPSNFIQDTTLAPKKWIRDAVGTITLNFLT